LKRRPLDGPRKPNHRLKELRRNAGLSPERLGLEAGGITGKAVRDIESGVTRDPRASTMRALAEALRTTVGDLESGGVGVRLTP